MNFGEIQQDVLDRLGARDTEANVVRAVRAAINAEYRSIAIKKDWDWLVTAGTITLTATTVWATVPSNCRRVLYVVLRSLGLALVHRPKMVEEIEKGTVDLRGRDIPQFWCAMGSLFQTQPLPATADTLDILYLRNITPLSATTDEPAFNQEFHNILVDGAVMRLAASDSFDPSIGKMAMALRQEGWQAMLHSSAMAGPAIQHQTQLFGQH